VEPKLWFAGSRTGKISKYSPKLNLKLQNEAPANIKWIYLDQPNEKHHTIFKAPKAQVFTWSLSEKLNNH